MSRLKWDQTGEKQYETGVDRGVVYPQVAGAYPKGAPWNGLTNATVTPSGAEPTPLWANNRKYANLMSAEEVGGKIEAFTYPDEFAECDGSATTKGGVRIRQQKRKPFGFTFRNKIGTDTDENYGYKIHLIYGALASPSEDSNSTINESPEAKTMSWEYSTTPVEIEGFDPSSHLEIDSTRVDATKLKELEDMLYGTEDSEAHLPLPDEVIELFPEITETT